MSHTEFRYSFNSTQNMSREDANQHNNSVQHTLITNASLQRSLYGLTGSAGVRVHLWQWRPVSQHRGNPLP